MKKINWAILNAAFWIEIVLTYFLPFKVTDDFQYEAGFPFQFITVYDTGPGINPFMSMQLNPIGLLLNAVILYMILSLCVKAYENYKRRQQK